MLDLLAALALASAPTAGSASSQLAAAPWWERITVTLGGDGQSQGCLYTSSNGDSSSDCTLENAAASSSGEHASGTRSQLTRITFERRFTPGGLPAGESNVQAGDTLIGSEVMALAIDGHGSVKGCKVVATTGDMVLDYGCAEARAERFQASATRGSAVQRDGYMTVLIYAHPEHVA